MLKWLRNKKTAKKIWIGLAIIIVPAFVFWGFGEALRSSKQSGTVVRLAGRNISAQEYREALEAVKNAALMQFGDKFAEVQKYLNLNQQALERIILLSEARKRRISASDREVIELVESYPFFQRKGQFDKSIYDQMLRYVFRTQARAFEEQARQNLILSKFYKQITANVKVTDDEVKNEYQRLNEQISIYYIAALPADFAKSCTAAENEIREYFNKNSLEFKQPVSYNLEYITLDSEAKAKDAAARLGKKEDLAGVAKEMGAPVKETGFFTQADPIPGIGWSPEVLMEIAKLKPGKFAPAVKVDKNYYLLRLKEIRESYIPKFEETKEKAKKAFMRDKAKQIAKTKIESCLKSLKEAYKTNPKSADFNKAAKQSGLKSASTELFKYGSYIEGIGASDAFWSAAKNLKEDGSFSEIISLPSGFYIVKVKSKAPVDEKKFEAEKKEFGEKLLESKKQEYFVKFSEGLSRKTGLMPPSDINLP